MDIKKEMTAHNTPAGTGVEQSPKDCINSISNNGKSVKVDNSRQTQLIFPRCRCPSKRNV